MAYALVRFGDIDLPENMVEDDLSTGTVDSSLLDSVGGVFDSVGTRRRLPRRQTIDHTGQYVGETTYWVDEAGNRLVDEAGNYLIFGNATQMLQAKLDALKALRGTRAQLWRRRDQDGILHWKWARLLSVTHTQGQERAAAVAIVTGRFETSVAEWHAATETITSVSVAAATPTGLTVNVGGEATVYDANLRVARTAGTITGVAIVGPGIDLTWAGSIGAGQTLTIDCEASTVRVNAADAYLGLSLGGGHTARGWLVFTPGANPLVVTLTGGAATVAVNLYDQVA